ncbi:MAG: restriction endonuclease subunit S [Verrucomicrobia bacterium]|nr:restriction endonuclease subunit S [Verrucomicrobiota bacterium]
MSSNMKTTATKEEARPALVPKLRFPEFRGAKGWDAAILGDLSEVVRGGSPRPIDGFMTTSADGLNWLKIGDVDKEAKFVTQTAEKVRQEALSKTRVVNPGDLILSNSMSFGRPYILQITTCIHDGWIAITKISKKTDRDFLYYLISAPGSQSYFLDNAAGSGVLNLNADIIKALRVCFPSPSEQQKIAECLSSVDELMAAQARKVDALKTHKKGLMRQLFPREGETQPRLRFPEFQNAEEWEEVALGDIAEIKLGKMLDKQKHTTGRLLPYLNNVSVRWNEVNTSNLPQMFFNDSELDRFGLRAGDVVVCEGGEPGRAAVWDGRLPDLKFQKAIHRVRFNVPFEPRLLVLHLENLAGTTQFEMLFTGGGIKHFTRETFAQLKIPLIPHAEQQRIATCLSSLDALITAETRKLEALKTHKKGLMQQLFPSPTISTS